MLCFCMFSPIITIVNKCKIQILVVGTPISHYFFSFFNHNTMFQVIGTTILSIVHLYFFLFDHTHTFLNYVIIITKETTHSFQISLILSSKSPPITESGSSGSTTVFRSKGFVQLRKNRARAKFRVVGTTVSLE